MKLTSFLCGALLCSTGLIAQASPLATVGQPAPNFTLKGADRNDHSLADYKGKYIVLEWTNPDCPFVKKFYNSNAMQTLQRDETAKGGSLAAHQLRRPGP